MRRVERMGDDEPARILPHRLQVGEPEARGARRHHRARRATRLDLGIERLLHPEPLGDAFLHEIHALDCLGRRRCDRDQGLGGKGRGMAELDQGRPDRGPELPHAPRRIGPRIVERHREPLGGEKGGPALADQPGADHGDAPCSHADGRIHVVQGQDPYIQINDI
jgi:hypothetical protein